MFWLTPESLPGTPPGETAAGLLEGAERPLAGKHRTSDALRTFAADRDVGGGVGGGLGAGLRRGEEGRKKTMLLKIGRASNVQRRLNEWTRQCGYNLSLIRYYPYTAPSKARHDRPRKEHRGAEPMPRKVPHAHKVERLIHIELAGRGLRVGGAGGNGGRDVGKCDRCGSLHREWFEVEASREGVRSVDEVVRRWVDWGLRGG
jgi:hypothetical protein